MYEWYKNIIKNIDLINVVINNDNFIVADKCSDFLNMKEIR